MGTDTIAVVFFIFMMIMTATIAIMTVFYATRLPSSRRPAASRSPEGQVSNNRSESGPSPRPGMNDQDVQPAVRRKERTKMSFLFKRTKTGNTREVTLETSSRKGEEGTTDTPRQASGTPTAAPPPPVPSPTSEPELNRNNTETGIETDVGVGKAEIGPRAEEGQYKQGNTERGDEREATPSAPTPSPVVEEPKLEVDKVRPESGERDGAGETKPEPQKSGMGDLSDLFARVAIEDDKASQLAQGMGEVNIEDLLKQGLGLVDRLKKPRL